MVKATGETNYNFPIPATYVIDSNHKIIKAWVDANYTKRAEPNEVLFAY
ncbi:MAG: hypothetical protein WC162_05125 [Sphaerochaetaceae bacterium]